MSQKSRQIIYLDHAAATPLDSRVFSVMKPFLISEHGNPSALYRSGVVARQAVENARRQVADVLHTNPDTVVFTGGGTEGNNMALFGVCRQALVTRYTLQGEKRSKDQKIKRLLPHIITTNTEHSSVLEPIRQLEKEGCKVTYLSVDANGLITVDQVKKAIKKNTALISIGYANNEIGTIQPIAEIGKMLLQYRKQVPSTHRGGAGRGLVQYPIFHTDACQAVNYCDLSVEKLHVDLMTINSSKIYGPKGVGALFVRRGITLEPIIYGGGQERGLRSGTEHVAGIVGFAEALRLTEERKEKSAQGGPASGGEVKRLQQLQEYFWRTLCHLEPRSSQDKLRGAESKDPFLLNGVSLAKRIDNNFTRLPNNLNVHIPNIEAETLILYLDAAGIECSAGSACSTDSYGSSHVLRAIGLSEKEAKECVRFTMGRSTTKRDVTRTVKELKKIVRLLYAK